MPRGKPLEFPGVYAIDMQEGRNWRIVPSTESQRESIRSIQRTKYSYSKLCWFCKQGFDYGYTSLHVCGACKIIAKCAVCDKEFEVDMSRYSGGDQSKFNDAMFHGQDMTVFCSNKCRLEAQSQTELQFHKDHPGLRKRQFEQECSIKWCESCQQKTKHHGNYCMRCHGKMAAQKMIQYGKDNPDKERLHRQRCAESVNNWWKEHPELHAQISLQNLGQYVHPVFVKTDGKTLYHHRKLDQLMTIEELLLRFDLPEDDPRHLDYLDCPGFEKRLGQWCHEKVDLLSGKRILLKGKGFLQQDQLYYYDLKQNEYVLWDDFKRQFVARPVQGLPDGFRAVPTFRAQGSESWEGSRQAFEMNLVDMNVGWFVYVKFYLDRDGKMRPLVAGKSGSLLVNDSGSDVNFSMDPKDGPARHLLLEEGLQWCVTQISVLPCESEAEAYTEELKLQQGLGLLGS